MARHPNGSGSRSSADEGSCEQVHNHYGPTQTTVGVTTYRVYPRSYGHLYQHADWLPLADAQAYILKKRRWSQCRLAVSGSISGVILWRVAICARQELTAERFIPDPFAPPSALTPPRPHRLYRTGDWARYLPDGAIDYLGRMDDQIKIHGFRIELGEIEAQIKEHPAVETSLVLARTNGRGEKQLVAYVVAKAQEGQVTALQTATVREYLKQKLPSHLIPAAIVLLEALPFTGTWQS